MTSPLWPRADDDGVVFSQVPIVASPWHNVIQMHHAVRKPPRREQFQRDRPAPWRNQRNAFADQYRNHMDAEFINLPGIQK